MSDSQKTPTSDPVTKPTAASKADAATLAAAHVNDLDDLLSGCALAVAQGISIFNGALVQKHLYTPMGRDIAVAAFLHLAHAYDTRFAKAHNDTAKFVERGLYTQGYLQSIIGTIAKIGPFQAARTMDASADAASNTVTLWEETRSEIGRRMDAATASAYQQPVLQPPPPPPPPHAGMSAATAAALQRFRQG